MLTHKHRLYLRRLALLVGIPWFVMWGHAAYVSLEARDAAEAARFAAEAKQDWSSAAIHEQEGRAAAEDLVRSVAWGFFLPLALLVAAEIDMGFRRVTGRDDEAG
jgi:hypothetical protein